MLLLTHRGRLALGSALVMALLASCEDSSAPLDPVACGDDRDCQAPLVCEFSYCVSAEPNRTVLHARVVPPASSGLLPQQIPSLTFTEGPDRLIHLVEPAIVRGVVRPRGDGFITNMPGTLEVRTSGDIEGLDYKFEARSWDGVDEDGDGFMLRVLPGRRYLGTFRADDRSVPPFSFMLTTEEIERGRLEVLLPMETEYLRIEGRVRQVDYTPIAAAHIIALDPHNNVIGAVSTEPVRGQFDLVLPPDASEIRLKVQSPPDGPVFPDFVTEPITPEEPIDITIPVLPTGTEPFDAQIRVSALDSSGTLTPMPGLTVAIVGDLVGGTLRRTATTDADGVAQILTLPGAYECLVTTPPNSPWTSWHGRLNLASFSGSNGSPEEVVLDRRLALFGDVTDALGAPLATGEIYATRKLARGDDDALTIAPPPFRVAITEGRFVLLVDPGDYLLQVVPATATGAPAEIFDGIRVDRKLELHLALPEPALAHITIAAPSGAYLEGATIELFRPRPSDATPSEGDAAAPPLLIKGTTSEEGFVDLFIPFTP